MGGFTFKPGGRVKLDVIRDFKPIGSEDSFDTRTIPVDGSEGTNSNIHAKETRLNLDIRGTVEGQELRMFIETDFYGTSSALRLRHAYGSWGGLLAGQTWSTFMDDDNLPRTIDFEAPTAFAQIRQAQARWTQKLADWLTWSAAVEDNKSAILLPVGIPGQGRVSDARPRRRVPLRFPARPRDDLGFLGAARFRPAVEDASGNTDRDTVTLWGTMVSAKFIPFGKDYAYGVFTYGDGIGRYRGGTTAVPDETGKLHAVGGTAFMGGYEHFWAERWSTNARLQRRATLSNEDFYTSAVNKRLDLRRGEPPVLVPGRPRVDRRRVPVRQPRGVRRGREHRLGAPGAVCRSLQPALSGRRGQRRVRFVSSLVALGAWAVVMHAQAPDPSTGRVRGRRRPHSAPGPILSSCR